MHCVVRLVGNGFRGFLVQARLPGNTPGSGVDPMLLGSFQAGSGQQTLACDLLAGAANDVSSCDLVYIIIGNTNLFSCRLPLPTHKVKLMSPQYSSPGQPPALQGMWTFSELNSAWYLSLYPMQLHCCSCSGHTFRCH